MTKRNSLRLIVNACTRCGGTAYLEDPHENEWRCLQCARTVPVAQQAAATRRPTAA